MSAFVSANQIRMVIGKELGEKLGLDKDTQICPRHPRLQSEEGVKRIILKPFKNYIEIKGKLVLDSMGVMCPKCYYTREVDLKTGENQLHIAEEDREKSVKSSLDLSPTG